MLRFFLVFLIAGLASYPASAVELKDQTVKAFQDYVSTADREMAERGAAATRLSIPPDGKYQITPWRGDGTRDVFEGIIHDWAGAQFLPSVKAETVVAVLQDYANYPRIYSPDLLETRVLNSSADRRKLRMRVLKRKVISVMLDMEYDIVFRKYPSGANQIWSRADRISEVIDAGTATESVKPPGTGFGFLWRLYTYWHIVPRDGGTYIECRAISLTRDLPAGLSWIIKPMLTSMPRESLVNTLDATRREVERRMR